MYDIVVGVFALGRGGIERLAAELMMGVVTGARRDWKPRGIEVASLVRATEPSVDMCTSCKPTVQAPRVVGREYTIAAMIGMDGSGDGRSEIEVGGQEVLEFNDARSRGFGVELSSEAGRSS